MQLQPIIERTALASNTGVRILGDQSARDVAQLVRDSGKQAVWIEGFSGAGKSDFAQRLAHELGWHVVELDGQLLEEQPDTASYADKINRERLAQTLAEVRERGVVIDGVCLRDAIAAMFARSDVFVAYVARVSEPTPGTLLWHDGLSLEEPPIPDEPWLFAVINEYHRRHVPHYDADVVLLRIE